VYRENALDPATLHLHFPKEKKEIKKERKNFLLTHMRSFQFLLKKKRLEQRQRQAMIPLFSAF